MASEATGLGSRQPRPRELPSCPARAAGVPDAFLYQRHREALVQDALRAMAGEAGASDAFSERLAVVLGGQD